MIFNNFNKKIKLYKKSIFLLKKIIKILLEEIAKIIKDNQIFKKNR